MRRSHSRWNSYQVDDTLKAAAAIFVYYRRSFYDILKYIERFDITCFRVYTIPYFRALKGQ